MILEKRGFIWITVMVAMFTGNSSARGQIADNGSYLFSAINQTIQVANSYTPKIGITGDMDGASYWIPPVGVSAVDTKLVTVELAGDYTKSYQGSTVCFRIQRIPVGITVTDNGNGTATISGIDVAFTSAGGGINLLCQQDGEMCFDFNKLTYIVTHGVYVLKTSDGFPENGLYEIQIDANFQDVPVEPAFAIFDLEREYKQSTSSVLLQMKWTEGTGYTFKVNGLAATHLSLATKGVFLIEATSPDGKTKMFMNVEIK